MKWLERLFRKREIEAQIDSELRFHVEQKTADLIAQGVETVEARRRAMAKLGGIEAIKQEYRESRATHFLESMLADLLYAVRMLRKSPGFTVVAVLTLALGIGANTAIFSAVNGILLEPLPYPNPGRLVEIDGVQREPLGHLAYGVSAPDIRDVRRQCPAFEGIALYWGAGRPTMLGGGAPVLIGETMVSGNFFGLAGVRPLLGRPILPPDTMPGNRRVAVLDYATWKSEFGGDPNVLGRRITLDSKPYTIVGVMPSRFHLSLYSGWSLVLWVPVVPHGFLATSRASHNYGAIARLRPGATLATANAQLKTLSARLAATYPAADKGMQLSAKSEKDEELGSSVSKELSVLLAAVGLVLLIACVNVSSMLLARSWTRHREVAIRQALGATRRRIARQFLVESLLLSLAGGALGLLLAVWLVPVLRAIAPAGTPRIDRLRIDANVLYFTLVVSLLSGVLFGLAPALRASGDKVGVSLKEGLGGLLEGFSARGPRRLHGALVIIEVALAVILATGATLVARSLRNMMAVPLGYRKDSMLGVGPVLFGSACTDLQNPQPCRLAATEILRRLRALPGVEAVTVAGSAPMYGGYGVGYVEVQGRGGRTHTVSGAALNFAAPGYFRVMGIPLLAGRDFSNADTSTSRRVAIVNRAFAKRYLGNASPLGRRIGWQKDKHGRMKWMEIVGEASDVHDEAISLSHEPEIYLPAVQVYETAIAPTFLLRTTQSPVALIPAVKQAIWSVDKDAPIPELKTMNQIVALNEANPRFRTALLGAFGVLGLLLAMVGIYGVISYGVSCRTREIGLRMALGARPSDALRIVIRGGMLLAGVGIVIGIGGALALTRLLRSYLFEITPTDPVTFVSVALLLAVAALLACYVPARRAMRVDPMVALRHE